MRRGGRCAALVALLALAACGPGEVPAAELGASLFRDPAVSTSPFNRISCATCHTVGVRSSASAVGERHAGRLTPGSDLAGATRRPSWWGGYETRFVDAMNACVREFMGGAVLETSDLRARELFEYLDQGANGAAQPAWPLTVVKDATALSALTGDATRGADVYGRSCRDCHGDPHTGKGRVSDRTSIVPEDTLKVFPTNARAVVVEKVRHGKFFNVGGVMPLYPAEAMSDDEVADVLAYLGL